MVVGLVVVVVVEVVVVWVDGLFILVVVVESCVVE